MVIAAMDVDTEKISITNKPKMKTELQLRALCELDGVPEPHTPSSDEIKSGSYYQFEPAYLTSYDAIIPLIQKQSHLMQTQLIDFLCEQAIEEYDGSDYVKQSDLPLLLFKQSPAQLSEALLRATNRWTE